MNVRRNTMAEYSDSVERISNYSGILFELGTSIVICDEDLNIVLINPSAQSLLDVSEKQALGDSVVGYFEQQTTEKFLKRCMLDSQSTTLRQSELMDSNRRLKLIDCILTPATIEGSSYLILEFNEVNEVARQLLENTIEFGQSANSAVIRSITHEIKNPLGGLRGAAQLLDRELDTHSELRDYTRIIVKEADRLCSLVDDMSGPQIPLRLIKMNIHEVLEHVRILALAEKDDSLQVIRDYDPSLPDVLGDREQLIQVFINIVRNAIEAIDNSGKLILRTRVQRQVTLGKIRYQSVAKIEIEDNGTGIPEGILDQVFYPMISGKSNGEGLGLSIVRQIITRHEGAVTCQSKPGRTCFTILLKFADQSCIPEQSHQNFNGVAA